MTSGVQVAQRGRQIDREACLTALAAGEIARVVYHQAALPAVEVVVYDLVDDGIVFSVPDGSGLAGVEEGSVLALTVDTVDGEGSGLCVLVTGKVRELAEARGAGNGADRPTPDGSPRTLVIPLQRLSGHRVALALRR
ncbi:MAG TPA: pyridoxamine 5'-phosphate oxidase family protein [Actinomycetospora sp.]|uniref:pyridoxamine 5'-phosphate oxidase family protein n=1 Tax=Actinomycetospora sp. TaxID=1872135 RepID=UPI002F42ECF3